MILNKHDISERTAKWLAMREEAQIRLNTWLVEECRYWSREGFECRHRQRMNLINDPAWAILSDQRSKEAQKYQDDEFTQKLKETDDKEENPF